MYPEKNSKAITFYDIYLCQGWRIFNGGNYQIQYPANKKIHDISITRLQKYWKVINFPVDVYLLKVSNRNTRTSCEKRSKVNNNDTRTTPMASFVCLYCKLWTYFTFFSGVFIVNFEQLVAGWVVSACEISAGESFFLVWWQKFWWEKIKMTKLLWDQNWINYFFD